MGGGTSTHLKPLHPNKNLVLMIKVEGFSYQSSKILLIKLESTASYVGLLLANAEGFGLGQGFFWANKLIFYASFPILGNFSSNLNRLT